MAGQAERSVDEEMALSEVARVWRARSRSFHEVEIDHDGGGVGMAGEILHGQGVGSARRNDDAHLRWPSTPSAAGSQ